MKCLLFATLALILACSELFAQSAAVSQISGTVQDTSGLAIAGAQVTVTQTETGLSRSAESGPDGAYVIPSLPVGPYRLEVKKAGFAAYVQSGIVLQVNSNPSIEVSLKVGSVSEQVLVEAAAAMVETQSTGVGQVIDQQRVVDLPLNGRQATQLITLAGGASTTAVYQNLTSTKNYPGEAVVSVAGGQTNGLTYLLDGASHNDPFNNLNLPLPFPDALQEFKVETSALPAQYGYHSAGAVNVVTKSGTNQFHGDAFEFVRNQIFNARDFFAPTRDTLKRNQYGGTFGGPIRKDKLFFFVGYQATVQRSTPTTSFAFVPTPTMLTGDFTAITSPACNGGRQITLKAPFADNKISPTLFSSPALKMLKYYEPLPTDPCGKVQYGLLNNLNEHMATGKIDYQIRSNHSFFGRYYVTDLSVPSGYTGTQVSLQTPGFNDMVNSVTLGDTYIFGPNTINSFHATLNRTAVVKDSPPFFTPKDLGISNFTVLLPGFTGIYINNAFSSSCNVCPRGQIFVTAYQLSDDVSVVRGAHQMGFGANWISPVHHSILNGQSGASFTFNGQTTNLPMADFMIGTPSNFTQANSQRNDARHHYVGLYAQDSWRVSPRLKVNYGLRWEPYFGAVLRQGQVSHFDHALFLQNVHSTVYSNSPAGVLFPGDPGFDTGGRPHNIRWNNYAPRFGLVWDPKGDGRMTVRASWGMFNEVAHTLFFDDYSREPPWGSSISLDNPVGGFADPWLGYPGGNPFPTKLDKNATFPTNAYWETTPLDLKTTYVHQFNFSIQRQLGPNWLASASYLGNSTIHLWTDREQDPAIYLPDPTCVLNGVPYTPCSTVANTLRRRVFSLENQSQGQYFGTMNLLDDGGTASFHGMLLSLQHRLANNFTVLGNYTWSHCISDLVTTELAGPAYTNPNNRRSDRGNCRFVDVRHIFNLSVVANSPKFSDRWMQAIAGDWQLSVIAGAKSGSYFGVTTGVDNALTGVGQQRPNQVNPDPYCPNRNPSCWVNFGAFANPATGTLGNLGYGNLIGPGYFNLDVGLVRVFPITERHRIQIRAEAFNIQNRANFGNPATVTYPYGPGAVMTSATFGKILTANPPRIMQFALKYMF